MLLTKSNLKQNFVANGRKLQSFGGFFFLRIGGDSKVLDPIMYTHFVLK